jgi:hypothetical protein
MNNIVWQEYIVKSGQIVTIMTFIVLLIGLWKWRHHNKPLRIFFYYIFATLVLHFVEQGFIWATRKSTYYDEFKPFLDTFGITSTAFLSIFVFLKNVILLGWFYIVLLAKEPITIYLKKVIWILIITEIISYLFVEGHNSFGIINPTIDGIFCFVFPMIYLWFLYNFGKLIPLFKNSFYLISTGLIIQNLFGLLYFFTSDKLYETDIVMYSIVSIVRNGIDIIGYLFFAYAFYQAKYAKYLVVKL